MRRTKSPKSISGFHSMRIKTKIFLLLSISMIICYGITWSGLQIAYSIYDEMIYDKSALVLDLSSSIIEKEMKRLERLSFSMVTDEQFQQTLKGLNANHSEFDQNKIHPKIIDRLLGYSNSQSYVMSAMIINNYEHEYSTGNNPFTLTADKKAVIQQLAEQNKGGIAWLDPDDPDPALIAVRQIRSYENLELEPLGTLVIRVNLNSIVSDVALEAGLNENDVLIMSGESMLYPDESAFRGLIAADSNLGLSENGYSLKKLSGENYFVSHLLSPYTGWVYYNVISFQSIFHSITVMKNWVLAAFGFSLITVMLFGMIVARSITRPLEGLISRMRGLQINGLESSPIDTIAPLSVRTDEVGLLQRTYRMMIQRIQELILEDYAKQLIIKETKFKALQAQINPHFLYNTLDSINWLSKMNGQPRISQMVESLGSLLRASISLKATLITVEEEIALVQSYVLIQKVRFAERLEFKLQISAEVRAALIPKLTLQPLLENSIRHAMEVTLEPCLIWITGSTTSKGVELIVEDNGPGFDQELLNHIWSREPETEGTGIGIRNIEQRIRYAFGEDYGLDIENGASGGARIIVRIPAAKEDGSSV
ncbi:MAG: sensor histidine kinase [Gorillibacterium sp.]|nr:sensor histidine kinase [Gorillibacterium sp.]